MKTRKRTDKVKGRVKKSKADAEPKEEGRKRVSAPNSGSRTTLQKHVDFFDSDRDGKITFLETYQGLRRLGLGAARSVVFGGVINAALGSSTSRTPSLTVDADHINAGKHASDTGVYPAACAGTLASAPAGREIRGNREPLRLREAERGLGSRGEPR